MSIASEITRLQTAKADLKTAIEGKGVTVAASALLDDYPDLVDAIQTGGGGISVDDIASGTEPGGDIVLSNDVTKIADNAFYTKPLTSITANAITTIGGGAFQNCANLKKIVIRGTNTTAGGYAFRSCSALEELRLPNAATTFGFGGYGLQGCGALKVIDYGNANTLAFNNMNAENFNTLILRRTNGVQTLNANSLNNSAFKSGGAGGTVYIPEAMYDHLGDGTSLDYKVATNWSVYQGYGTITWEKLEGSIWE